MTAVATFTLLAGTAAPERGMTRRIHRRGSSPGLAFLALLGAAGLRSAPSALMVPLEQEFGWDALRAVDRRVSVNILSTG